jgi:flavin-dependent dehydrogenase
VIPPHRLSELGASAEEQYDSIFSKDPVLSHYTTNARRITRVAKYNNYQLISDRFFGSNWVLVGDAAGFVDPIFSSGLQLALDGAHELAEAISDLRIRQESSSSQGSTFVTLLPLQRYENRLKRKLRLWQRVVETFYTGRLFGLTRAARLYEDRFPWKLLIPGAEARLRRTLSGMLAPESLQFKSSTWMLKASFGDRFGERLAIK